jgi:hypothetical protein
MENLEQDIKKIIDAIDALKGKYDFKDEDNEEEAWDELESAVISLESFKEICERDVEYSKVKDFLD